MKRKKPGAARHVLGGTVNHPTRPDVPPGVTGRSSTARRGPQGSVSDEALVRAWLHPEAIAERPARPWLFAVARNLAVDAYRARRARPREVGEAALELIPAPDEADRALESWAVADALRALRLALEERGLAP